MAVDGDVVASYRIWYATCVGGRESSSATRAAMDIAATRLGCVMPIMPGLSTRWTQSQNARHRSEN